MSEPPYGTSLGVTGTAGYHAHSLVWIRRPWCLISYNSGAAEDVNERLVKTNSSQKVLIVGVLSFATVGERVFEKASRDVPVVEKFGL